MSLKQKNTIKVQYCRQKGNNKTILPVLNTNNNPIDSMKQAVKKLDLTDTPHFAFSHLNTTLTVANMILISNHIDLVFMYSTSCSIFFSGRR